MDELEMTSNEAAESTVKSVEITAEANNAPVEPEEVSPEEDACADVVRSVERQKGILSYLHDLVFGLTIVLLVFMLFLRMVIVSGPSMLPTLHDGDRLILLNSILYGNPKYGDIIVASKDSFKNGEPIIKRVIATEGQTVDIDFGAGVVYVDGQALDEPYTNTPTTLKEGTTFPLTVSKGCVFVMGDNRNDSLDSRSMEIGQIDRREILGRVLFLIMPGKDPFTQKRDLSRIGALS